MYYGASQLGTEIRSRDHPHHRLAVEIDCVCIRERSKHTLLVNHPETVRVSSQSELPRWVRAIEYLLILINYILFRKFQ